MSKIRTAVLLLVAALTPATSFAEGAGILLLAHGGRAEWNAHVLALAEKVNQTQPVEVAFGMASRATIQAALDRLASRGVSEIVAVPLFVSSWSSIITSTEYLLGLRPDAPPDLAMYAKMDHSHSHTGTAGKVAASGDDQHAPAVSGATPVVSRVPIRRITPALNAHPVVGQILTARARSISRAPVEEAVVIVAHGPVADEENRRWLADMKAVAGAIAGAERFASIDYMTVRDDAPKPIRDAVTQELRTLVSGRIAEGRRVLIVPLLMSFGGIEKGIATRLEGLAYTLTAAALMPDDRLVAWVLEMANGSSTARP